MIKSTTPTEREWEKERERKKEEERGVKEESAGCEDTRRTVQCTYCSTSSENSIDAFIDGQTARKSKKGKSWDNW